jgi:hypothetical protein
MGLEEFEALGERADEQEYQVNICDQTFEPFVRFLVGRHRGKPEIKLLMLLRDQLQLAESLGCLPPMPDPSTPLWATVEIIENIVEFNLVPPCGCVPRQPVSFAEA